MALQKSAKCNFVTTTSWDTTTHVYLTKPKLIIYFMDHHDHSLHLLNFDDVFFLAELASEYDISRRLIPQIRSGLIYKSTLVHKYLNMKSLTYINFSWIYLKVIYGFHSLYYNCMLNICIFFIKHSMLDIGHYYSSTENIPLPYVIIIFLT